MTNDLQRAIEYWGKPERRHEWFDMINDAAKHDAATQLNVLLEAAQRVNAMQGALEVALGNGNEGLYCEDWNRDNGEAGFWIKYSDYETIKEAISTIQKAGK